MIGSLLPGSVAWAEAFGDDPGRVPADELYAEEWAVVADAVPARQREFAVVRGCARRALAELGLPPVPLLPGHRNAVVWPEGVVGSMTHTTGYRAAALARRADLAGIGIDAEPDLPLPDGVLGSVARPAELRHVAALTAARPAVAWDRLLFSAKEAVYKTWFPLARRELDFPDAEIVFDPADGRAGTFSARLLVPGLPLGGGKVTRFEGRWAADGGLLVSAIALAAPGDRSAPEDRSASEDRSAPGA
ncbi:4'-phosphopantetheinyl transferase family protein [Streptomyces purpureus]|uniref:4'-phosphopantetheinyl transferase n=1 Tax=Streptomyces purpureus TaxID=1951 RepID=A0A918LVS2_9ACTN|nr:4'-phosphopantetheinyl transferase superfamily protein [Streptomyces purpureus]GGT59467.1 4'-phosphopantetheinyl transferase [Streptomyces purpureus]